MMEAYPNFETCVSARNGDCAMWKPVLYVFTNTVITKGKGKVRPRKGYIGPEGE
jgi:hypothetical protein